MTDSNNSPNSESALSNKTTSHETADGVESSTGPNFKPLRIWPAILFTIGIIATRFLPQRIENGPSYLVMLIIFGPLCFGILNLLWWLFASRATIKERLVGFAGVLVTAIVTWLFLSQSMHGPGILLITVPMGFGLFGLAAILFSKVLSFKRTVIIVLFTMFGFTSSLLLRSDGMWGSFELGLRWRWTETAEEILLSQDKKLSEEKPVEVSSSKLDAYLANPEWPAFRGQNRNGMQTGVTLATEWDSKVSTPLWKIPVGPGWSSFVVAGEMLFTQEQRGEMESISCYDSKTGDTVWRHNVQSRFEEAMGGPGPRATPTLAGGKLFILGANGNFLKLDPKSGKTIWAKELQTIADRKPPEWGFSSSPLVVDSLVIVHAGGKDDKGTLAFDIETGDLKWSVASGDHSYCSPQLVTIAGQKVVAMMTNKELSLLNPTDGKVLLKYDCEITGYRALQPQLFEDDSILITNNMASGVHRIRITNSDGKWAAEKVWSSKQLKVDFNDYVIYQGHAYGFDGRLFTCISLEDGKRKWKRGRYGKGQVLLLDQSGQLLVISEKGDVVLLKADPSGHSELAKFKAIEGKTWNHPVLIGDQLFVRNSEQAASYRLPLAK